MKSIAFCLTLFASLAALANTSVDHTVTCTGPGVVKLVEGEVKDGILTSTVSINWNNRIFQIANIQFNEDAGTESYYLLENEASSKLTFEGLQLFLPQSLHIDKNFNKTHTWLPALNEQGEKSPILVAFKLSCEKN